MIFDNPLEKQRLEKVERLKELGKNPYAHNIVKDSDTVTFAKDYAYVKELEDHRDESKESTLSGRVKFVRLMGKAAFAKIEDTHGMLQIYFARDRIGEEWFKEFKKLLDIGDIVLVKGFPFVTKTGELSLNATSIEIVTKSITPLPEKFHGLKDMELKYRQRYLDMIMDAEVKKRFIVRSKVVSTIRNFFEDKGFLEVETPMMHPIAGGANARPFVTHHNALGVDRFLRIAPELYLKRLVVGGFDAVFEINRNFRNEGMDHTHNPEFTMIEFYWAYHTYEDLMNVTEELFHALLAKLDLPQILPYGEHEIDYRSFARVKYLDALVDIGGVPADIITDVVKIRAYLSEKGIHVKEGLNLGYLQAELFDEFVEEKLINPTFITQFPIEISPLARRNEEESHIADRFELFIAGKEIGNGFNELNDPVDQYERFSAQIDAKDAGDDEAHEMDEDYVKALGYGMSPTAGEGIGIDRLVMLLTNAHTIRDVIIFPAMKPIIKQEETEGESE